MEMDLEEVFEWEVQRLEAALKELDITIDTSQKKTKKVHEFKKALEQIKTGGQGTFKSMDPNFYMVQALQQVKAQSVAQAKAIAAIAAKISGSIENGNDLKSFVGLIR